MLRHWSQFVPNINPTSELIKLYIIIIVSRQRRLMSRFGLAIRRWAGKQKDLGSIPLRFSLLFKKVVVCGHCVVTVSLTINKTLKWLSSLSILMQESFWW